MGPNFNSSLESVAAYRLGQQQGVRDGIAACIVAVVLFKAVRRSMLDRVGIEKKVTYVSSK